MTRPVRPVRFAVAALAVAVIAVVGVVAGGCSGTNAVSQSVKGSNGYQVGDAALHWVDADDRVAVDGVTGTLLDGSSFDLSSWRGRVVVVNFWGSWCGPCQEETQALEEVHRDTEDRGVEFLGIDVRDDLPSARNFVRDHDVSYPSVYDESNLLALRFRGIPPNATPTTLVLDRKGRIAARHSGAILYTQLRSVVHRVLVEKT